MSRLSIARALNASGVMGATFATAASLIGIVGVIVSTPQFCPESLPAERCRVTSRNAAGLATQGVIVAGAAGLLIAGSRAIDPEA